MHPLDGLTPGDLHAEVDVREQFRELCQRRVVEDARRPPARLEILARRVNVSRPESGNKFRKLEHLKSKVWIPSSLRRMNDTRSALRRRPNSDRRMDNRKLRLVFELVGMDLINERIRPRERDM